jgi:hypothetical protein
MATEKIKCSACGFGALLFRTGESINLTIDLAKQIQVCHHFRDQPQTNARRVAPLDCRNFRETVQRPAGIDPGTRTAVKEAESEGLGNTQAAAEEAADKKPARSRTSRRAEVAKAEARSPKAKSARRPPRKTTSPRSAHSGDPTVAAGAQTVA